MSSLDHTFSYWSKAFSVIFTVALYRDRVSILSHIAFILVYYWTHQPGLALGETDLFEYFSSVCAMLNLAVF